MSVQKQLKETHNVGSITRASLTQCDTEREATPREGNKSPGGQSWGEEGCLRKVSACKEGM